MRSLAQLTLVLDLVASGLNDCEIARRTGVPRTTVRDWRRGKSQRLSRSVTTHEPCGVYHATRIPWPEYSYLLGMYLGDGCLSRACRSRKSWILRIFADARYQGIIDECARAMEAIFPAKRAGRLLRRDCACVVISMYSRHWVCLFPQHGPGRKHNRRIELSDWQQTIVDAYPRRFLRGLIHSDGCRHVACERKGRNVRFAPRYMFSNRSEDIKRLFCEVCDKLEIRWTRPTARAIAVYRLSSVALLDDFVGPKY